MNDLKCLVDGCVKPVFVRASQLCKLHYGRQWRGKPLVKQPRLTMRERFELQYEKTSGCWLWNSGIDKNGYGLFTYDLRTHRATRLAWQFAHGEIPEGMMICHRCDNPSCVNPAHLFAGTAEDNARDMMNKKRWHGSPTTKLSMAQANMLRNEHSGKHGDSVRLAKKYGISNGHVSKILRRECWNDQISGGA